MISAVIITKNEATCIENCIRSVLPVADEVIVIDSNSTDDTCRLAASLGAIVIRQNWQGFGQQKNFGIETAKYDYILSVDADESLDTKLQQAILAEKKQGLQGAYSLHFLHHYYGIPTYYGLENPQWKVRLFNARHFVWDGKDVHESLLIPDDYPVKKLPGRILHFGYDTVAQHALKSETYSTLGATELFKKGKKNYRWKMIAAPAFTFFQSYFLKRGFLDGGLGFVLAKWNAYNTWLKYVKLWGLYQNQKMQQRIKKPPTIK